MPDSKSALFSSCLWHSDGMQNLKLCSFQVVSQYLQCPGRGSQLAAACVRACVCVCPVSPSPEANVSQPDIAQLRDTTTAPYTCIWKIAVWSRVAGCSSRHIRRRRHKGGSLPHRGMPRAQFRHSRLHLALWYTAYPHTRTYRLAPPPNTHIYT